MKFIVAVDKEWGIGNKGDLLARVRADLARFRRLTAGKVVVYGSNTLATFPGGKVLFAAPDVRSAGLVRLHDAVRGEQKETFPWAPHATILIDEPDAVADALRLLSRDFRPFEAAVTRLHLCAFWPTREIAAFGLEGER